MLRTVEVRWFFTGDIPISVQDWFTAAAPSAAGEAPRDDYYLNIEDQNGLGIKIREGRLEVKERQFSLGICRFHKAIIGRMDSWAKWGINLKISISKPANQVADIWVPVTKERQMNSYILTEGNWRSRGGKLGIKEEGCEIELSKINISSRIWWTFAFEAPGIPDQGRKLLLSASEQFFAKHDPPPFFLEDSYSYPRWIGREIWIGS